MEKAYFPMFVDISKKKILVVGGGKIAYRRIKTLLLFAADIMVVAPKLEAKLQSLVTTGQIGYLSDWYREELLADKDIVLAVTDDQKVNHSIAIACRKQGIMVNVADDQRLCDFYFPGVVKQDEIILGIGSGGRDPGKVKRIREWLMRKLQEIDEVQ